MPDAPGAPATGGDHRATFPARTLRFLSALLVVFALTLSVARAAEKPSVFVSIPPMRLFAERIAGGLVDVLVMVEPGANPATYEPSPRQMARLAESTVFFAVGVPFEKAWLPRLAGTNPNLTVVRTYEGVRRMPMTGHDESGHDDHHGHGHTQGEPDPHIWLSPPLARQMADAILAGLVEAVPEQAGTFRNGHAALVREMEALDAELADLLAPVRGREFLVFHPSWGYFAERYGLIQIPIEIEGKEPGAAELARLVERARRMRPAAVFVQPQFAGSAARTIAAEVGAEVVTADPLAEDWAGNLRQVGRSIARAATPVP